MSDVTQSEMMYGEGRAETQSANPVVEKAQEAFDTAATPIEKSVYDAHMEAWQKIKDAIPPDQQNGLNVKIADFWNNVGARVNDVSAKVVDVVADNNLYALAYRGIGKLRGVEVPTGQNQEMAKAELQARGIVNAEKMKQSVSNHETFKRIIPGGKVLDIVDRIFGPKM